MIGIPGAGWQEGRSEEPCMQRAGCSYRTLVPSRGLQQMVHEHVKNRIQFTYRGFSSLIHDKGCCADPVSRVSSCPEPKWILGLSIAMDGLRE